MVRVRFHIGKARIKVPDKPDILRWGFQQDKEYDPYPEGIFIHDNRIKEGGTAPKGEIGLVLTPLLGKPLPDSEIVMLYVDRVSLSR